MKLVTLKKRHEFLRVRGGVRFQCAAFVLEAKQRPGPAQDPSGARDRGAAQHGALDDMHRPRFGFTATKRLGGAVKRNRIRRRIKAAIAKTVEAGAMADTDYVVIARAAAFDVAFDELVEQFRRGFDFVARRVGDGGGRRGPRRPANNDRSNAGNRGSDPTNTGPENNLAAP